MPTCRICKQVFPQDQFITGNGPRYLVCVRCGVELGFVSAEETPQLYSDEIVRGRTALYARRYGIWMTLFVGWMIFLSVGRGITFWSPAIFVVLLLFFELSHRIRNLTRARLIKKQRVIKVILFEKLF